MSVIAPHDTIPRYKSLFPFGESRPVFFFSTNPKDRDLASIIPRMGMRNGERRRYAYARAAIFPCGEIFSAEN